MRKKSQNLRRTFFKERKMKEKIISLITTCLAVGLMVQTSCNRQDEITPLKDGLYLEYEFLMSGPIGREEFALLVKFARNDRNHYRVNITGVGSGAERLQLQTEGKSDMMVDEFFKTNRGNYLEVAVGQLWLPRSRRRIGAKIREGRIREIRNWQKWEVAVLHAGIASANMNWYYERRTGLLVGAEIEHMGAGMYVTLRSTNAQGL